MRYRWVMVLLLVAGCREGDGPLDGTGTGTLVVDSDPRHASISLDGQATGRFTPDTLRNLNGLRQVVVSLDSGGITYRYSAEVAITGRDTVELNGPLMARCQSQANDCSHAYFSSRTAGGMRVGTNALGALFFDRGSGGGLYWPAASENSYLSAGTPLFGAMWETQPVSIGVYDTEFLAGRPAPLTVALAGGASAITQNAWLLPPFSLLQLGVARGIRIDERVVVSPDHDGVLLVQLTFRNISAEPVYQLLDPYLPEAGITFEDAYVGLALDPDIGDAEDDWLSYDASLNAVFAYDADFAEGGFSTQSSAPALLGLRVLRAPAGAAAVLNGWVNTGQTPDWEAGTTLQFHGYAMLSGGESYAPDFPGPTVGHMPAQAGDVRITATVGPLQLAPGDSATVVLGVALAPPAGGSYVSGQPVAPGSPDDTARPLYAIAANLRARLLATEALLGMAGQ